jgi:hypothetical protein
VTFSAIKPNQQQVTTNITQENVIIERLHKVVLARYPQPEFINFDNGSMSEFKHEFKHICIQDN